MNIKQKKQKKTNTSADDFVNDCVKNHNSAGTRNPATTSLFTCRHPLPRSPSYPRFLTALKGHFVDIWGVFVFKC